MTDDREGPYPIKWITSHLAVGYAPHSHADIDAIKANGITSVLNLCAECYDLHEIEIAAGMDVYWLPLHDEDAPPFDAAQKAIAWLDARIKSENKVLVHCRFGIGRTGTMVLAWLMSQGYAPDHAMDLMGHTPSRPNSRRQWDFLESYGKTIGISSITRPVDIKARRSRLGKFFDKYLLMDEWWLK